MTAGIGKLIYDVYELPDELVVHPDCDNSCPETYNGWTCSLQPGNHKTHIAVQCATKMLCAVWETP